ncbi:MAG TPA: hypothetical protein VKY27_10150 [Bacteriovoracaceae bacterium]|nr:hypothetical protein [Bacteriovoracaceae bacterium]
MKIFILLFLSLSAWSQVFLPVPQISFEQNPSHLKWRKIDTPHFEIIFPEDVEASAQITAKILESAYPLVSHSLKVRPEKISIILQSKNLDSNGFVTLAPRRSEFFLSPSLDPEMTNTEWLTTLGIHELRHVVQFDKTKQGFNRYYEIFLGEIGVALGLAFTTPPWFLEGDAVGIETALTRGGRGRLPLFERDLKALSLNKEYKLDQLLFGSYDYYTPNHYVYGYFFTSFLRDHLKDEYHELINRSAEKSYNPLSFYYRAEETLGRRFDDFIKDRMKEMIAFWKTQKFTPMESQELSPKIIEGWTNYLYPQYVDENRIFALKNGLGDINHFVILKDGKEKAIYYPGPFIQRYPIKLRKKKFAIVEKQFHPRWGLEDFSTLHVLDLKGKTIFKKKDLKWRMAIIDHTGTKVAGISWEDSQKQYLSIIDLSKKSEKRIRVSEDILITSFDWINLDELVLVGKRKDFKQAIYRFNLNNEKLTEIFNTQNTNLGFVTSENKRIFIESPHTGIDNIFELVDGKPLKVTSSQYGAYSPDIVNDDIIFNNYSFRGMKIERSPIKVIEEDNVPTSDLYKRFVQSESMFKFNDLPDYKVEDYSRLKNSFNFHSWNLISPVLSPTISGELFSRDLLNENALSLGAFYNYNEGTTGAYFSGAYMRYYPVLSYGLFYQGRSSQRTIDGRSQRDRWEEGVAEVGFHLPWKKLSGRFTQNFNFYGFNKLIHVMGKAPLDQREVNHGTLYSVGANISYSTVSRLAPRDLLSPYGLTFQGHYETGKEISGGNLRGDLLSLDARVYLPGLYKHHSFYHQFAYEKQNARTYEYASLVLFPRGLEQFFLDEYFKYSANYTFPLFYPDEDFGKFLYLKRISTNLFYDDLNGKIMDIHYQAKSTGAELLFETYLFRLMTPVVLGLRYSHVIEGIEEDNFGFFINTSLSTF